MIRALVLLATVLSLTVPRPAQALFHFSVIDEVHATAEDGAGFVEIRMLGSSQNSVGHSRLSAWNCDGSFKGIVLEVPGNVANSGANVRWLMATGTGAVGGILPDFTFPLNSLPLACGMVCWGAPGFGTPENPPTWDATLPGNYVDCVAYGSYTGTNVPAASGTPSTASASDPTFSLTRIATNNNNSTDFELLCPTPTNNGGDVGDFGGCATTTTLPGATTTTTTETTTTTTTTSTSSTTVTTTSSVTSTSDTVSTSTVTTVTTIGPSTTTTTLPTTTSTTTSTSTSSTTSTSTTTSSSTSSSTSTTSTSTTSSTVPPRTRNLLTGKLLLLKGKPGKAAKSAVAMQSADAGITLGLGNGSADDPTVNGGSIRFVSSASGAFDQTYPLAGGWKYLGKSGQNKGYKWSGRGGPIASIVVKKGKLLQVAGHGAGVSGLTLAVNPLPVRAVVSLGTLDYCLEFGGFARFTTGKTFKATNAPAPSACP